MKVEEKEVGNNCEVTEECESENVATCSASLDVECQTGSDFMDEYKRMKDELVLFKQANQDLCDVIANLRQNIDILSLSIAFLKNNTKILYR